MSIDDPAGILIRQAEESAADASYLPAQITRLGLSAGFASALASIPFVSQVITSLIGASPARLEERFLAVAKELDAQQKRLESRIPDKSYYESEEFHLLLSLVIEKLHTARDQEKLRMFGTALANCGSAEFAADDKEEFIRTLRDLSTKDLHILNSEHLKGWTPHVQKIKYDGEVLSSLARLQGMGLVVEHLQTKTPAMRSTGSPKLDAELMLQDLITQPPPRTFGLSVFGERFLQFLATQEKTRA